MYVFKSSFLKAKKTKDGYVNINLTTLRMSDIVEDYLDGFITLTHTQLRGTFYLTLDALRATDLPLNTAHTFNQWLTHNHDKQLPVINKMPIYKQGVVRYGDAFLSGFQVNQIARHMTKNANTSKADKTDLLLIKGLPDKNALYKRMLVSVNGFIHRTEAHENGLAVIGGGETFNNTGINTVGILSFYDACDIKQYPINQSMIAPTSSTSPLNHELLINMGFSLVDKSVMLSLGGYLITDNNVVEIVNAETGVVIVRLGELDMIDMIMGSIGVLSLDELGVFRETRNVTYNKVRPQDIESDIVIKKYLQLVQSFVIVAECNSIHTGYEDINITGLPGVYETASEPQYPMVDSKGILYEYLKDDTDGVWSVRVQNDITKRYMHKTNIATDNEMINSMSPTHKWFYDDPKLLKITTVIKPIFK